MQTSEKQSFRTLKAFELKASHFTNEVEVICENGGRTFWFNTEQEAFDWLEVNHYIERTTKPNI